MTLKKIGKGIIIIIVLATIIGIKGNQNSESSYEDSSYNDSTYDYNYTADYEEGESYGSSGTSSNNYSDYNQTAPDSAVFTASDITGRWTDSPGSEVGTFLDITYSGGQLKYDYYDILYGNSIQMNLNNEKTKWETANGYVKMQANHGTFMCMKSNGYESYVSFYYIDRNTICHQEKGKYFYRVY